MSTRLLARPNILGFQGADLIFMVQGRPLYMILIYGYMTYGVEVMT